MVEALLFRLHSASGGMKYLYFIETVSKPTGALLRQYPS